MHNDIWSFVCSVPSNTMSLGVAAIDGFYFFVSAFVILSKHKIFSHFYIELNDGKIFFSSFVFHCLGCHHCRLFGVRSLRVFFLLCNFDVSILCVLCRFIENMSASNVALSKQTKNPQRWRRPKGKREKTNLKNDWENGDDCSFT